MARLLYNMLTCLISLVTLLTLYLCDFHRVCRILKLSNILLGPSSGTNTVLCSAFPVFCNDVVNERWQTDTETDASLLLLDATSHPRTKDYDFIPLRVEENWNPYHNANNVLKTLEWWHMGFDSDATKMAGDQQSARNCSQVI